MTDQQEKQQDKPQESKQQNSGRNEPVSVPVDNISSGNLPKIKEKTEIGVDVRDVNPVGVGDKAFTKDISYVTRYTWNIFHVGNEQSPVFTVSLVESNPDRVAERFWLVLAQNVSENDIKKYIPRLKSIEVL